LTAKIGGNRIFGNGKAVKVGKKNDDSALYEDLGHDGSAVVMQIEMSRDRDAREGFEKEGEKGEKGAKGGGKKKGAGAGGGAKKKK
jgi:hypothetical protein